MAYDYYGNTDLPSSEEDVVGRFETLGEDLLLEDLDAPLPFLDTFLVTLTTGPETLPLLFSPAVTFC